MKKVILIIGLILSYGLNSFAGNDDKDEVIYVSEDEQQLPDSVINKISNVELGEVVVKGSTMINKADRKLLIPTSEQVKMSKNGVQLLGNMQLPGIAINPLEGTIKLVDNGKLDIRINGRPAQVNDVKSIDPQYIVRVEYHDNPSMRYGDAEVVIDFIVKNPTTGGNVIASATQSVNRGWGNYYVSGKMNHKKSEFGVSYSFNPRWNFGVWRDNKETYTMPDGKSFERNETGEPGDWDFFNNWAQAAYTFSEPDKMLFSAQLNLSSSRRPRYNLRGELTSSNTDKVISMTDDNSENYLNPSLDLYFQRNLSKSQLIMFNLVGGYNSSESDRHYMESYEDGLNITDIKTSISGSGYTLVAEGDYEKSWKKMRFTGGVKHTQKWNDNTYKSSDFTDRIRQGETYVFGEWWHGLSDKFDYTLGVGMSRYYFHQEGNEETSSVIFRPKISLRYRINDKSSLKFDVMNYGTSPSISELSDVEQDIDQYQVQIGNPQLKPYQTYRLNLEYEYAKGIFYGKIRTRYWNAPKAIMGEKYWEGDKIVNTYDNQRRMQELRFDVNFKIEPIKDWLTISGLLGWHRYIMNGNRYTHCYNNCFFDGTIQITHWNFVLSGEIITNYNRFWGETLTGGENAHIISLVYTYKDMNFGVMVLDPFINDYHVPSENWNKYAGYKREMRFNQLQQLFALTFNYSFSWGRKHKSASKRLNNEAGGEAVKAVGK